MRQNMDVNMMLRQSQIIQDAKTRQTAEEKHIYTNFHVRTHIELNYPIENTIYELETRTRQELLNRITPYFTQIMQYLTTPAELELLNQRYPRWIENIFTRNTIRSNYVYMESMTLCPTWASNNWNNIAFNMFCQKLYDEMTALLQACRILPKTFVDFKFVVRVVTQIGGWRTPDPSLYHEISKICEMGNLFGSTEDDDEAGPMYPEYLTNGLFGAFDMI